MSSPKYWFLWFNGVVYPQRKYTFFFSKPELLLTSSLALQIRRSEPDKLLDYCGSGCDNTYEHCRFLYSQRNERILT